MKANKLFHVFAINVLSISAHQCYAQKMWRNIGTGLGQGLGQGLSTTTKTIGQTLVAGVRDELTSHESEVKLSKLIDSVLAPVLLSVKQTTADIRDSIISHKVLLWADSLRETLAGTKLNENMRNIQASMVGKTKTDVLQMLYHVHLLLGEVLSDSTKEKAGRLRDELLGPKTNMAITKIIDTAVNHIVDSSMTKIADRYRTEIDPLLKNDVSFVSKHTIALLLTIGGIAAFIILLVWQSRKKYLRMVALLAKQIHDIPDQQVYDTVTSKIKGEAITTGLEPDLRDILNKNGLIGTSAWQKHSN